MILATVILMDILGGAEVDLFVPSFPELGRQFNLTPFWLEALLSVNFVGFFLSLLFVGGLADRYGRRPIILVGLTTFIIGSSLCLWASSYESLVIGRFFQGLGIAAPAVLCFLIIADSYSLKEQQSLMAILNGLINASIGAAPIVGSYITIHYHWQGNFTALVFSGLIVLIMTILFIPTNKPPENKEPISLSGYIPIFKSKPLRLLMINLISMFVPYWIFIGMSPILYMEDLGVSLSEFGYYQGSLAFTFAVGSVLSGFIVNKFDQKKMLYISAKLSVVGLIIIAAVAILDVKDPLVITITYLLFNTALIIPSTILYPICINYIPEAKGRISSALQGGRLIIATLGLELAAYFYEGSFQNMGIIISCIMAVSVITTFMVMKNREIMNLLKK